MKIWLVLGESESSDKYYAVFSNKPSEELLEKLANSWDGNEERSGPASYGSYVWITVKELEIDKNGT